MGRFLDLTGHKFGMLTVIQFDSKDNFGRTKWMCQCDCGNISTVQSGNLKTGISKSCGCKLKNPSLNRRNYDGLVFGRLKVLASERVNGKTYCFCECSCGKKVKVWAGHLPSGHTKSCGCYRNEICAKILIERQTGKFGSESKRYNPKLSQEDRGRIRLKVDKEWSKKILKINGYTCLKCNERGKYMHAHHLDGYKENKEKRTMISNGVVLCKSCHIEYHSTYGIKNIKESDFHKWINAPEYNILDSDLKNEIPTEGDLGNVLKCILRQDKKTKEIEDLKKALWYLNRKITNLENNLEKK
jgi:hypothetical protein